MAVTGVNKNKLSCHSLSLWNTNRNTDLLITNYLTERFAAFRCDLFKSCFNRSLTWATSLINIKLFHARNTLEPSSADDCPHVHFHIAFLHLPSASNSQTLLLPLFSVVAENDGAIWSCGKLEARAQGQMAPSKQCPGGRGRQSAAYCLHTGMHHLTLLEPYSWPFLESAHWNTLKASTALPRATVEESCSMAVLCLLKVLSRWLEAIATLGWSVFISRWCKARC